MKNKLIITLTRVNDDGTEENLLNEELGCVAIIGECYENEHKLLEVIAQTSVKNIGLDIAQSEKLIEAAKVAVAAKNLIPILNAFDNETLSEMKKNLADQINGGKDNGGENEVGI